ncbi:MAG: bacteriohemerythrin [Pseudodesulfovibrio sp.]
MPIVSWKDEYSVGIAKIDDEHKQLIAMIDEAHDYVESQPSSDAVKKLLAAMENYAISHFDTEEAYMKVYDYPGTKGHKAEHAIFLEQVRAGDVNFADDTFVPGTVKILSFLADWLVTHILGSDKQFGDFLMEKGAK